MASIEVEACLRPKNQITLPEPIARRLGVEPGDRLIFAIDEDNPKQVQMRPLLRSYYGILEGVYGTDEEIEAYLREERASWAE